MLEDGQRHLGIDFDNTLVSYDALFHKLACEQNLVPGGFPPSKLRIRDHLRAEGREQEWTRLQGIAYGTRILEAVPYDGALEFLRKYGASRMRFSIISHKTKHPYLGESCDLHNAARNWLKHWGVLDLPGCSGCFFERTRDEKLARIIQQQCTDFIDDLPEVLTHPAFPQGVNRIHFDPVVSDHQTPGISRIRCWAEVSKFFGL